MRISLLPIVIVPCALPISNYGCQRAGVNYLPVIRYNSKGAFIARRADIVSDNNAIHKDRVAFNAHKPGSSVGKRPFYS